MTTINVKPGFLAAMTAAHAESSYYRLVNGVEYVIAFLNEEGSALGVASQKAQTINLISGSLRYRVGEDTVLPTGPRVNAPANITIAAASKVAIEVIGLEAVIQVLSYNDSAKLLRWEDLRFPSTGINPPGAASDPAKSTTTGLLEFSGTQDNILAGVAQMPHAWAEQTTVKPHFHARFPTSAAANSRWKFEFDKATPNGDFANDSGVYTTLATVTAANPQNVRRHALVPFGDLTMVGMLISTNILWKLTRLAASDAADNDTSVIELLDLDFHILLDASGSRLETLK